MPADWIVYRGFVAACRELGAEDDWSRHVCLCCLYLLVSSPAEKEERSGSLDKTRAALASPLDHPKAWKMRCLHFAFSE